MLIDAMLTPVTNANRGRSEDALFVAVGFLFFRMFLSLPWGASITIFIASTAPMPRSSKDRSGETGHAAFAVQ